MSETVIKNEYKDVTETGLELPLTIANKLLRDLDNKINLKEKDFNTALIELSALEEKTHYDFTVHKLKILQAKADYYSNNKELDPITRGFLASLTKKAIENYTKKQI